MRVMKNTVEKQTTAREELSHLRMAWYLRASRGKPVGQQWETFKEKLKKVRGRPGHWQGRLVAWHT